MCLARLLRSFLSRNDGVQVLIIANRTGWSVGARHCERNGVERGCTSLRAERIGAWQPERSGAQRS